MNPMRHLTAAAAVVAALVLAACSPDAADFKSQAEKYIESREFSEDAGLLRYSDAECEEPESTAEDTRYTCTATAPDGTQWRFNVEITGERELEVSPSPEPVSAPGGESSTPDASSAATGASTTAATATTTTRPTTTTVVPRATTTAAAPRTAGSPTTT
jgi:Domain of unknown function (DUF4333)